jgi:acyl dehydratase
MARSRIVDIYDKGTAAVIRQETRLVRSDDTPLLTATSSLFVRGEGGFGGKRGPSGSAAPVDVPHGEPDAVLDIPTQPQQALLYRLCGDRNPLHTDPLAARAAGFPGPILQGACVYGMVCQAVVTAMLDGEASRVSRYSAGFSGVVFPGETLRTRVWKFGNRFTFTTSVLERPESRVLSGGELIAHYSRIRVGALSSRQASHRYIHSNDSTQTVVRRLK